ncbi:MAG TPA: hypothetical protein VF313_01565 [Anaerolineaceae bacterium]
MIIRKNNNTQTTARPPWRRAGVTRHALAARIGGTTPQPVVIYTPDQVSSRQAAQGIQQVGAPIPIGEHGGLFQPSNAMVSSTRQANTSRRITGSS